MKTRFFFLFVLFVCFGFPARAQWVKTNGPFTLYNPPPVKITSFASIGSTIFASRNTPGIYRSTDNGASWNVLTNVPGAGTLYANGKTIFAANGNDLYISTDSGGSWDSTVFSYPPDPDFSIVAIVQNGNNIVVGTGSDPVYVSSDNGSSWTDTLNVLASNGKWYVEPFSTVQCLTLFQSNVYAGLIIGGVAVSTDGGFHWMLTGKGPDQVNALTSTGGILFAATRTGVFSTSDGGTSWIQDSIGLPTLWFNSLASNGNTVYAGSNSGVFVSTNTGASWSACGDTGLTNLSINALLVCGSTLLAGTNEGIFASSDNGSHWTGPFPALQQPSVITSHINSLDSSGGNVFACTQAGLFTTNDSGAGWIIDSAGMGAISVRSVFAFGKELFACAGGGLYLSSNNGFNWTASSSKLGGISNIFQNGSTFYGATTRGVYISKDSGITWTNPGNVGAPTTSSIVAIDTELIAGGNSQAYYSPDSGKDWYASIGITPTATAYMIMLTRVGNLLFAGTSTDGVWISADSGMNWSEVNDGITDLDITSLMLSGTELFAGSPGGEVFVSTDSAKSWSAVSKTFPMNDPIVSLALRNENLYAATADSGIWRYTLAKPDSLKSLVVGFHNHPVTLISFPDPTKDFVHVTIPNNDAIASTHIYNAVEQEMHPPVDFNGGMLTVDARQLLSGSYFMSIKGNSGYTYVVRFSRE